MNWGQWKRLPETKAFLKQINGRIQEAASVSLLDPDSSDRTLANVALRDGHIEAYEDVFEIIRENMRRTDE